MRTIKKISESKLLEFKKYLKYNKSTGIFKWRTNKGTSKKNQKAGNLNSIGYVVIKINRTAYLAHRLAFIFINGIKNQSKEIDHKNGIRSDNKIKNLRISSSSQQCQNRKLSIRNTTGIKGVYFRKDDKTFTVSITYKYKTFSRYYIKTFNEAKNIIKKMRKKIHGEFANHG